MGGAKLNLAAATFQCSILVRSYTQPNNVLCYSNDSPQDLWADKVEQILDQLEEGRGEEHWPERLEQCQYERWLWLPPPPPPPYWLPWRRYLHIHHVVVLDTDWLIPSPPLSTFHLLPGEVKYINLTQLQKKLRAIYVYRG